MAIKINERRYRIWLTQTLREQCGNVINFNSGKKFDNLTKKPLFLNKETVDKITDRLRNGFFVSVIDEIIEENDHLKNIYITEQLKIKKKAGFDLSLIDEV